MNAILAALVNGMLASAGLAFTVWVALRLAPGSLLNAATRYMVWWVVLVVAVALPVFYLPVNDAAAGVAVPLTESAKRISTPAATEAPHELQTAVSPLPATALMSPRRPVFPLTLSGGLWPGQIVIAWLVTSVLMMIRLVGSVVVLERRKARAANPPQALAVQLEQWTVWCGGSERRVRLGISSEISVPLVAGPWNSTILLPARLLKELSERELEQIGIHEAAHLVRRDDYALLIQRAVEAVFALHPVVRWISKRIDLEREIACDDFVIAATGDSQPYAKCLARVVELSGGVRALPAAAAAVVDRSHLARRVEMLLDNTRNTGTRLLGLRLTAAAFCIATLSWGAALMPGVLDFARPADPMPVAEHERLPDTVVMPALPQARLLAQVERAPTSPGTLPAPAPPEMPRAPIHVDTRLVRFNVTVTDAGGNVVPNLPQSAFQIFENNVAQPIGIFNSEDEPVSMGLLIDNSGSMRSKLPQVEAAMMALLKDSNPQDEAFVVNFNDEAFLDVDFTSDIKVIQGGLARANARGGTAFRDAIEMALGHMRDRAARMKRVIVVVTDGNDNASKVALDRLISVAEQDGAEIYTIGLLSDEAAPEAARARAAMKLLAGSTVGSAFFPNDVNETEAIARQVAYGIRHQYTIWYTPLNDSLDGTFRNVSVTVNAPGNPVARTRLGYWATDYRKVAGGNLQ